MKKKVKKPRAVSKEVALKPRRGRPRKSDKTVTMESNRKPDSLKTLIREIKKDLKRINKGSKKLGLLWDKTKTEQASLLDNLEMRLKQIKKVAKAGKRGRKPGRKLKAAAAVPVEKKRRGRKPKAVIYVPVEKKRRGRPRKKAAVQKAVEQAEKNTEPIEKESQVKQTAKKRGPKPQTIQEEKLVTPIPKPGKKRIKKVVVKPVTKLVVKPEATPDAKIIAPQPAISVVPNTEPKTE